MAAASHPRPSRRAHQRRRTTHPTRRATAGVLRRQLLTIASGANAVAVDGAIASQTAMLRPQLPTAEVAFINHLLLLLQLQMVLSARQMWTMMWHTLTANPFVPRASGALTAACANVRDAGFAHAARSLRTTRLSANARRGAAMNTTMTTARDANARAASFVPMGRHARRHSPTTASTSSATPSVQLSLPPLTARCAR